MTFDPFISPIDGTGNDDTTLAGLTGTMDLSDIYCDDMRYLCAKVLRGNGAQPAFALDGYQSDRNLIGCMEVDCKGNKIQTVTKKIIHSKNVKFGKFIGTYSALFFHII